MMGFLIRYRYFVLTGTVIVVLSIGWGVQRKIFNRGYAACEIKHELELKKGREKREQKEKEIIRLPVDDLRRRYCEWVRDDKQKCLQSNIPISGG